jgi:hypothetical protein
MNATKLNKKVILSLSEEELQKFEEITFHLYKSGKIFSPKKSLVIRQWLLQERYNQMKENK